MKFERKHLINILEAEIERRRALCVQANEEALQRYEAALDEHVKATSEAWAAFATTIRKRIRTGVPVTFDDLPEALRDGGRSYPRWWSTPAPTPRLPQVEGFQALLKVLRAVADEEISLSALATLGAPARELLKALR